jgi:hypothetical protein
MPGRNGRQLSDYPRKAKSVKNLPLILIMVVLVVFSFGSCSDNVVSNENQTSFFDLKGYFETEITKLANVRNVKKATTINDNREEKVFDTLDFDVELAAFVDSDINKVAWMDKYVVDTLYDLSGTLKKLHYLSLDEKLRTQQLMISFNQTEVDTIEVFNNTSSNIAKLQQHLRYIPSQGYSIESRQKTPIAEENVIVVEVKFPK